MTYKSAQSSLRFLGEIHYAEVYCPAPVPLELDSEHGPFWRQFQATGRRSGGLGFDRGPDASLVETFLSLYKSAFFMARSRRRPEVDGAVESHNEELIRLHLREQRGPRR
jgi:hypothetical protein